MKRPGLSSLSSTAKGIVTRPAGSNPHLAVPCAQNKDRRVLVAVELFLNYGCGHSPTLTDLAKTLNLSDSRFRHVFKKETGSSPGQYLKRVRLERARQMVKDSFSSVKEIMAAVGLADESHFVRDYKQLYGETPSQTRGSRKGCLRNTPRIGHFRQ
jgi:transcriptional regulator GlxA family with amidase domain